MKLPIDLAEKILVGLANSNPNYGVHPRGHLTSQTLREIWDAGITRLDSAQDYVYAEEVISKSNSNWRIQTKVKLPETYHSYKNLYEAAKAAIRNTKVEGLLIHTPDLYLKERADHLVSDLRRISEILNIPKIGISIYRPQEVENLNNWQELDVIQVPHNPLDSNCIDWFTSLGQTRLPKLQARSIYLQGLLIPKMNQSESLPPELLEGLADWKKWLLEFDLNPQFYCATFAFGNSIIDEIVVGVDSSEQMRQLVENLVDVRVLPRYPKSIPAQFTDPRRWTH